MCTLVLCTQVSEPTGRLARWSLYLQTYDFEITHRNGKKHSNVDLLSRPILMANAVKTKQTVNVLDVSSKNLN